MPALCGDVSSQFDHASYRVEMRIDGSPVASFPLRRVHSPNQYDGVTLTGHTIVQLAKGSNVKFFLVPENITPREYIIVAGQAHLSVKKEPWF